MATITVSRQLGSLGTQIAHEIALRLSYRVVWREVINQAARKAGAPEMALAEIDELGLLGICPSPNEQDAYHLAMRQVMNDLAAKGEIVIIGRAGQVILRERPDVLHVKIMAPAELRAERIAGAQSIPIAAARAQVAASDATRREYLLHCFDARWDDPALYDLVINTRHLLPQDAGDLICLALERHTGENSPEMTTEGEPDID